MKNTKAILVATALCLGAADASVALAQTPPLTQTIRITTPFTPGTASDVALRVLGDKLGSRFGTPVVVVNQPGAGGAPAARTALNATDNATFTLFSNATALALTLYDNLGFNPTTDFKPVVGMSSFSYVAAVPAASKYQSFAEVLAYAKANPGKLNFGSGPAGTTPYIASQILKSVAKMDFQLIAYRGSSELFVAVNQGAVDVMVDTYGPLRGAIADGRIRVLGVTSGKRFSLLPNTPTLAEQGAAGMDVSTWNGIYANSKTSPEVVTKLGDEITEVLKDPDLQKRFAELGVEVMPLPANDLDTRMRSEITKWSELAKAGVIQKE